MAEKSGGLFAGAGFKLPDAVPDAAQPAAGSSLFEGAGFALPTAPLTGAAAAAAATTAEQELNRSMLPQPGRVATPEREDPSFAMFGNERWRIKPAVIGREIRNIGGAVADEAVAGGRSTVGGITNALQGQPGTGTAQAGLGLLQTLFSPLAAIKHVATQATGNKDFGDKAALLVPGRALTGAVAKAVPEVNALNTLVRDIPAKELPNVISRLESNPSLSAMDVAPNVQSKAMGISTGEPSRGAAHLFETAARRAEESTPRLTKAFDEAMGPVPDTVKLLEKHKADVREVGRTQIEPVLQRTGVVDITPVVAQIDEKIGARTLAALKEGKAPPQGLTPTQQRLWNLREDLTYRGPDGKPQIKDQYFMDPTGKPGSTALDAGAHGIQSRLRAEAEQLSNSASGADRLLGGELGQIRGKLVDAIDKASMNGNPIPKEFRDLKVTTSSGKFDPTGAWFVRGDKPIYAQATPQAAKATLGPYADDLSKFESLSGANAAGSPITVWYKPGERGRAQREVELFQSNPGPNASKAEQAAFHREQGLNLGYPESAVNSYVAQRFGGPGPYRQSLASYRDEAHVQEAFDKGQTILSKATTGEGGLANRPEAWRAWKEGATEKEIAAAQLGARTAVDSAMGVARNEALAGRAIPDVRFVREKMEMLFGEANAKKIMAEADAEHAKAATNALLTANSKTARSRAAQEAIKPRDVGNILQLGQTAAPVVFAEGANALFGGGMTTGIPTALMLGAGGSRKLAQVTGRAHDIAKNDAYAMWASATAPEPREILLNALRSRSEQLGGGKKFGNALALTGSLPLPR